MHFCCYEIWTVQTKNQQKSLVVNSAHKYTGKPVSFLTKEHYKDVTQQKNLSIFFRAFVYFTSDQFTSLSFSSDLTVTSVKLLLQWDSLSVQWPYVLWTRLRPLHCHSHSLPAVSSTQHRQKAAQRGDNRRCTSLNVNRTAFEGLVSVTAHTSFIYKFNVICKNVHQASIKIAKILIKILHATVKLQAFICQN